MLRMSPGLPQGTHRKEQELLVLLRKSLKGPLAPGEPKNQRKNKCHAALDLPRTSALLTRASAEEQPVAHMLSPLMGKKAVAGVFVKCYALKTSREWTVGFVVEVAHALAVEAVLDLHQ